MMGELAAYVDDAFSRLASITLLSTCMYPVSPGE
jgi:hypothetical protein